MENGTLGGQKPLPSDYWCTPLPLSLILVPILSSTETTQGLLRVCGDITITTEQSMMSSEEFTSSLTIYPDISRSLPLTLRVHSNPADDPSRGILGSDKFLLPPIDIPPELNEFIIDATEPLSATIT
jgi:hypothetical protein